MLNVLYFYISTYCSMSEVANMTVLASSWFHAFPTCCSAMFWMILEWFELPLVLLVSLLFFIPHVLFFYCAIFIF